MTQVRFDFANGWSASLTIQSDGTDGSPMSASVIALAGGDAAKPEVVEISASADLAVRALAQIARRRPANVREPIEPIDVSAFVRAIAAIPLPASGTPSRAIDVAGSR